MDQIAGIAPGAARVAERAGAVLDRLEANVATIASLLNPARRPDSARLNSLLLATNTLVHDGFRLIATAGHDRAADFAAAPDDTARAAVQRAWTPVGTRMHHLQVTLVKWPQVKSMVQPQVNRRRRPLFEQPENLPDIVRARETAMDHIFAEIHDLWNRTVQDEAAREHGCFPDIPMAQSLFLKECHAASRVLRAMRPGHPGRFLDVGCGGGLKVMTAARFFERACGLEYDPGYAALAANLFRGLRHARCQVIEGDALTFENYADYDVIYFFRPLRENAALARMEQHIIATARPRTVLIAPYRSFEQRAGGYDCSHVAGHLHVTGVPQKEAARIRREAEFLGPDVPFGRDANLPMVWDPLVKVSRMNGFESGLGTESPMKDVNA